ncbi:hypothetical protein SDJN02_06759, partial [Cucurbita argyrosperma subsp. argyrosperma]
MKSQNCRAEKGKTAKRGNLAVRRKGLCKRARSGFYNAGSSRERSANCGTVARKLLVMEEQKKQEEKLKKIIEEEEIRLLRKEMIPKAQLMPFFDRPFSPQRILGIFFLSDFPFLLSQPMALNPSTSSSSSTSTRFPAMVSPPLSDSTIGLKNPHNHLDFTIPSSSFNLSAHSPLISSSFTVPD